MKNHPAYATEAGSKRLDVAARAICQAREHPFCKETCVAGCTADSEDLYTNGAFEAACAAVAAVDRYDDDPANQ
jgi:hypothetical protein